MHRLNEQYGPWAVITGASSGIGREMALLAASAGLNVVLVARNEEALEDMAVRLRAHGVEAIVIAGDLAQETMISRLKHETEGLDVGLLICSAGFGTSGHLLDSSLSDELAMIDLNIRSVLSLTWSFGRRFEKRGGGGIILMSSIVAFQGVPLAANYAATKAYVQTLGEGLHQEFRKFNVDVLCVAPGPTRSGFAERARMTMGATVSPETVARGAFKGLGSRATVRPGFLSWALELALKTLPRRGRIMVMASVMKGMTSKSA